MVQVYPCRMIFWLVADLTLSSSLNKLSFTSIVCYHDTGLGNDYYEIGLFLNVFIAQCLFYTIQTAICVFLRSLTTMLETQRGATAHVWFGQAMINNNGPDKNNGCSFFSWMIWIAYLLMFSAATTIRTVVVYEQIVSRSQKWTPQYISNIALLSSPTDKTHTLPSGTLKSFIVIYRQRDKCAFRTSSFKI